jgi:hypothetical protein
MMATSVVAAARQHDHVGDNDPPPDPPLKALQPMVGAAGQLHGAAHHTTTPFNAIAKSVAVREPGLLFVRSALRGVGTGLGESDLFHPQALGQPLVGGRKDTLVSSQHPRGVFEAVTMAAQERRQQLVIGGIAGSNELPVAKESAFHFGVVDLMPKLRLPGAGFAPADNLRMRLTETDHFLGCWQ